MCYANFCMLYFHVRDLYERRQAEVRRICLEKWQVSVKCIFYAFPKKDSEYADMLCFL